MTDSNTEFDALVEPLGELGEQLLRDSDYVRKHSVRLLPPGKTEPVTHIAGVPVRVGCQVRQLCSWCGATLVDYDRACIMVPEGQDLPPGTWGVGLLVEVSGPASLLVEHEDGAELPDNACAHD
jgi:hypothetical protein